MSRYVAVMAVIVGVLAPSAHAKLLVGSGGDWVDQIGIGDYVNTAGAQGEVHIYPYGEGSSNQLNTWHFNFSGLKPACGGFDSSSDQVFDSWDSPQHPTTVNLTVSPDGTSGHLTVTGTAYSSDCGFDVDYILDATMASSAAPQLRRLSDPYHSCAETDVASSCMEVNRPLTAAKATFTWCLGGVNAQSDPPVCSGVAPIGGNATTTMGLDKRYSPRITTEVVSTGHYQDVNDLYDTVMNTSVTITIGGLPNPCAPPSPACTLAP